MLTLQVLKMSKASSSGTKELSEKLMVEQAKRQEAEQKLQIVEKEKVG